MFVNYKNTLTMKVNKLIGKGMIALAACFSYASTGTAR